MQIFDSELCARCKGRGWCGQRCQILSKINQFFPKTKLHFSGSSPPEIFVGREGYPNVNTGILAPDEYGETEEMSMPEIWYEKNLSIQDILNHRSQLIYSRFKSKVSDARRQKKFLSTMQEISIASKSVSTEVFLEKPVKVHALIDKHVPIIGNPAPLKDIRLEENPHVEKKVDYLIYDTDVKSTVSMKELYKSNISISNIIKILSAGMLGLKKNRKLVPTRWSVTATDDTLSKFLLSKIRYYQEIGEIRLFNAEYVGNHYEFLLLPDKFSFEVIEAKMSGSVWNPFSQNTVVMQDYESFCGRKDYANNVTGAYYSNRIALCEYLQKIKRQASCLVMRECRPEYYAPLGVGILREASRDAFSKQPEIFNTIDEALQQAQTRMRLPTEFFRQKSWLLKNQGKQTRLSKWL
jgi:DNA repair protein NreA